MPDAPSYAREALLAGRYRLVRPLARGGMAEVWEGLDTVLSRPVAVKVLHRHLAADPGFAERFRREAVGAARLSHPNIVATYDFGTDAVEAAFIVMELVRGSDLRRVVEAEGRLEPSQVVAVCSQVADALDHAHGHGVVHRDVKPANVLLGEDGGDLDGRVKVADFGVARFTGGSDLTQTGALIGTAKYLSPEQVEGREPDRRSDVYSLGVVLYELLCGRVPFAAETELATALEHLRGEPLPLRQACPAVPLGLADVVAQAMARDPVARYQSAAELRRALLNVRLDDASSNLAPRAGQPPPASAARRPRGPSRPADPDPTGPSSAPGGPEQPASGDPTVVALGATAVGRTAPARPDAGRAATPAPVRPDATSSEPARSGATAVRPAPSSAPSSLRRRRRWLAPLAMVAVAGVAAVGLVLNPRSERGRAATSSPTPPGSASSTAPAPSAMPIASVTSFDPPPGDGSEGQRYVDRATDGDLRTVWETDRYNGRRFANLKTGVGLVVSLERATPLTSLRVASPQGGWSAQAYVAAEPAGALAGWGPPVDTKSATSAGEVTFDLRGRQGRAVLLWITDPGPDNKAQVAEVAVG